MPPHSKELFSLGVQLLLLQLQIQSETQEGDDRAGRLHSTSLLKQQQRLRMSPMLAGWSPLAFSHIPLPFLWAEAADFK